MTAEKGFYLRSKRLCVRCREVFRGGRRRIRKCLEGRKRGIWSGERKLPAEEERLFFPTGVPTRGNAFPKILGNPFNLLNAFPKMLGNRFRLLNAFPKTLGNPFNLLNAFPKTLGNRFNLLNAFPKTLGNPFEPPKCISQDVGKPF